MSRPVAITVIVIVVVAGLFGAGVFVGASIGGGDVTPYIFWGVVAIGVVVFYTGMAVGQVLRDALEDALFEEEPGEEEPGDGGDAGPIE